MVQLKHWNTIGILSSGAFGFNRICRNYRHTATEFIRSIGYGCAHILSQMARSVHNKFQRAVLGRMKHSFYFRPDTLRQL